MMKKLTSSQIAKLAGVSRSTVSRVVNGYDNVPASTRDRVMRIIHENDYHPHLSGQLLAGMKTGTLGFFWISEETIANSELSSSYLVHVTEAAARLGYLVLTSILTNLSEPENILWAKKIFLQGRVDAGIFIGADNDEPLIEELIAAGYVVGLFDHFHQARTEPNRISVNYERETGSKIIDYLYSLGHSKISLLHGGMNRYSSVMRKKSFLEAMQRHGMEIRPEWMHEGGISEQGGYDAANALFAQVAKGAEMPTAICANNDAVAFGAYKALAEMEVSIPGQISVTGIDGSIRMMQPPLTTIAFDYHDFFYSLVARTVAAVEQRPDNPTTEFFKGRLIERGSCKRL